MENVINEEAVIDTINELLHELHNWSSAYCQVIDGEEVSVDEIYRRRLRELGVDL